MRHKLAMLADGKFSPEALRVLVTIQDQVAEQVAKSKNAGTDCAGDRQTGKTRSASGSKTTGSTNAWDFASTFVEAGLDTDWLERISATVDDVDALVESAAECHRLDEVHHRDRAADEPDR